VDRAGGVEENGAVRPAVEAAARVLIAGDSLVSGKPGEQDNRDTND